MAAAQRFSTKAWTPKAGVRAGALTGDAISVASLSDTDADEFDDATAFMSIVAEAIKVNLDVCSSPEGLMAAAKKAWAASEDSKTYRECPSRATVAELEATVAKQPATTTGQLTRIKGGVEKAAATLQSAHARKQLQAAVTHITKLVNTASESPTVFDESAVGSIMSQVLTEMDKLLNHPSMDALFAPTAAQLETLDIAADDLRGELAKIDAAGVDDETLQTRLEAKSKLLDNLRARVKAYGDKVKLMLNEHKARATMTTRCDFMREVADKAKSGAAHWKACIDDADKARKAIAKWQEAEAAAARDRVKQAQSSFDKADKELKRLTQEDKQLHKEIMALLRRREAVRNAMAHAEVDKESATWQQDVAKAAQDAADREASELLADCNGVVAFAAVRMSAMKEVATFVASSTEAMRAGYEHLLTEVRSQEGDVHQQHIKHFAELYEELQIRYVAKGTTLSKAESDVSDLKLELELAVEREDGTAAAELKQRLAQKKEVVSKERNTVKELEKELEALQQQAESSYKALAALGEPAEPSFEDLVAAIHTKILQREKMRLVKEIEVDERRKSRKKARLDHITDIEERHVKLLTNGSSAATAAAASEQVVVRRRQKATTTSSRSRRTAVVESSDETQQEVAFSWPLCN